MKKTKIQSSLTKNVAIINGNGCHIKFGYKDSSNEALDEKGKKVI